MIIRNAEATDLGFILNQFNEAILHTTAVYEYEPFSMEYINRWFAEKQAQNFPVIVAEDDGQLLGFATYGTFRQRAGYRLTVEHSVYVELDHQGKGVGKNLLNSLMAIARNNNVHVMVGGIDASNPGSIEFHLSMGFEKCGHLKEVAWKFDRWLDLVFMQKTL